MENNLKKEGIIRYEIRSNLNNVLIVFQSDERGHPENVKSRIHAIVKANRSKILDEELKDSFYKSTIFVSNIKDGEACANNIDKEFGYYPIQYKTNVKNQEEEIITILKDIRNILKKRIT